MIGRTKTNGLHLSTTLILTYFFVALIAVVAAAGVALPLLQHYQDDQRTESHRSTVLEYTQSYDRMRNSLLQRTNSSNPNPFRDYFSQNITSTNSAHLWPATPPVEIVRQKFNDLATSYGRRIVVFTERDHEVKVDTEPDPNLSLQGETFPDIKIPLNTSQTNPAPKTSSSGTQNNSAPFETKITSPSGQELSLIYRSFNNSDRPNLFGLTAQQQPVAIIIAEVVPFPEARPVWGDLSLILVVAALAALTVSLIVGFLLARNLSRPLVHLTEATHAVARGDYDQQVSPEGGYELNQLAQSFNQMTRNVAESQRMQRQLIANVSHELKTPLTSIQGFSQAMLDGVLRRPEDFARPAEIISNETARMIRLVNGLLDLSKLESGQAALQLRQMNLAEMLKNCVESFAPRAEAGQVSLLAEFSPPLLLNGDSDRLRQVFNNLIDNALKYTPPRGYIRVKAHRSGPNIVVSVSDSGAGIPAVDLPHIFERFYQADKSRRRDLAQEGSGLGLAITKEIVTAHAGKIDATSQEGHGTIFTITLPALEPSQTLPSLDTTSSQAQLQTAPVINELVHKA